MDQITDSGRLIDLPAEAVPPPPPAKMSFVVDVHHFCVNILRVEEPGKPKPGIESVKLSMSDIYLDATVEGPAITLNTNVGRLALASHRLVLSGSDDTEGDGAAATSSFEFVKTEGTDEIPFIRSTVSIRPRPGDEDGGTITAVDADIAELKLIL